SGGTILIQALSGVDINGTVNLAGGTAGVGPSANAGGAGGVGRIRIETSGGSNINTSGITITSGVNVETSDLFTNSFQGKLATGCGSIDSDHNSSGDQFLTFFLILFLSLALPTITKVKH
ncbi:MAG: hypothetical protein COV38_03545, partial [Bdellovibrionales bacterium CG11_big_fil_rev_8_21_14_0_20_38_13]